MVQGVAGTEEESDEEGLISATAPRRGGYTSRSAGLCFFALAAA
jgi:hypothetical protein